ncbi:response regulator [Candidatus Woesearchaeota archaeon]|nr:response regulator [Candidatus Woesearchaeota archaeon]
MDTQEIETPKPLDVLVVDDEVEVGKVLAEIIKEYGDNATFANGGQRGIDLFIQRLEEARTSKSSDIKPYDLVLTDLSMPQITGYDVVSRVKKESPGTPVYVVTANKKDWAKISSQRGELQPDGFLDKPFDINDIFAFLTQVRANIKGPKH